jgi:hypothetical protein
MVGGCDEGASYLPTMTSFLRISPDMIGGGSLLCERVRETSQELWNGPVDALRESMGWSRSLLLRD